MTIKIVDAVNLGAPGFRVRVDLDAANPADAAEDPTRLLTLNWGSYAASKVSSETQAQYLTRLKTETQAIAREAAAKRNAVAPTKVALLVGADLT